jgi:hypothetical protein
MIWLLAIVGILGAFVAMPVAFALALILRAIQMVAGVVAGRVFAGAVYLYLAVIPLLGWAWLERWEATFVDMTGFIAEYSPGFVGAKILYFILVPTCIFTAIFLAVASLEAKRSKKRPLQTPKKAPV